MEIDVFSDVVCPWCLVGTARLQRVLANDGVKDAVVRMHPFLLRADTPDEGMNIHEELRKRYGRSLEGAWARLHAMAKEMGIELDLSKQPMTYPTIRAHTLIRAAKEKSNDVARALFEAYFLQAKNISDLDVLQEIASAHGLGDVRALLTDESELQKTRDEVSEAVELGIQGVPFFVFNGKIAISGAQPEEVFREAISRAELGVEAR